MIFRLVGKLLLSMSCACVVYKRIYNCIGVGGGVHNLDCNCFITHYSNFLRAEIEAQESGVIAIEKCPLID